MKQLLPDKSMVSLGTCPFCKGSIIKNDTITDKNTIIVRRYKTKNKNYEEDLDVVKREVKTFFNNKLPKDPTDENYGIQRLYVTAVRQLYLNFAPSLTRMVCALHAALNLKKMK